jgi:uncharacterized protein YebE (UPF0316 family)
VLPGSAALVPLGVFLAELTVVTLGTLRIIFIARGRRVLAPVLGLFEIMIWLYAISQIMKNLDNLACFLAFALGFMAGNFLGMWIERRLAMGMVIVRIFTHRDASNLIAELKAARFGFTCVNGEGATGPVRIVMTVVKRRQLDEVIRLIEACQPRAFYAVDDLQAASAGIFPLSVGRRNGVLPGMVAPVLRGDATATTQTEKVTIMSAEPCASHAGGDSDAARAA